MKMIFFVFLLIPVYADSASWDVGHPERSAWTKRTADVVSAVLPSLEKARDVTRFCPKFSSLSRPERIEFWVEVISVMAFYESNWSPKLHYGEPPPLGYDSIGLLQLSYEDKHYKFCTLNRKAKSLENPLLNLDCGIRILAQLVAKDGIIGSDKPYRGGARYWSVLREKRALPKVLAKLKNFEACR